MVCLLLLILLVCSEGVPTIAPFLPIDRQISISLSDLVLLIREGYPKFTSFSSEVMEMMKQLKVGTCLLRYEPEENTELMKKSLILPFFRAHVSASLLLDKAERKSLLYRLVGESI